MAAAFQGDFYLLRGKGEFGRRPQSTEGNTSLPFNLILYKCLDLYATIIISELYP